MWSALNRKARHIFARYLTIHEDQFAGLIDGAAGHAVDPDSDAFSKTWTKLLEWRKNWLCHYMREVDVLHATLLKNNLGYSSLPDDQLRDAYLPYFTQESFYQMTSKAVGGFIDWTATLQDENTNDMYRTVFTYSLV